MKYLYTYLILFTILSCGSEVDQNIKEIQGENKINKEVEIPEQFFEGVWKAYYLDQSILTFNLPKAFDAPFTILSIDDKGTKNIEAYFNLIELKKGGKLSKLSRGNVSIIEGVGFLIRPLTETLSGRWYISDFFGNYNIPFIKFNSNWNNGTTDTPVIDLDEPRYFVITYTVKKTNTCSTAGVGYLTIDGKRPVDEKGKPKPFYEGNSILTYGKKIEFSPTGIPCSDQARHILTIKIADPKSFSF